MQRRQNQKFRYDRRLRGLARSLRTNGTRGEAILWKKLKARQLGWQFHRQVPVHRYILDFYCHELKLAIEVDGESHRLCPSEKDAERQRELEKRGIRVMRFTESQVRKEIDFVVDAIASAIGSQ